MLDGIPPLVQEFGVRASRSTVRGVKLCNRNYLLRGSGSGTDRIEAGGSVS